MSTPYPPSLRDQLQRAGWLPKSKQALNDWVKAKVRMINMTDSDEPFAPVIQEFQEMIESDPELYMGFVQMFAEVPPPRPVRILPSVPSKILGSRRLIPS